MATEKADKQTPAGALPLFMSEKKKKAKARAALDGILPAVRDVIAWTLFNAGVLAFSFAFGNAYTLIITSIISQPPSWLLPEPVELTEAEEEVGGALVMLLYVCIVSQAAAGVLALKLPSHRRRLRLLLAYVAVVATTAGHGMFAGLHGMLVAAEPGVIAVGNTVAIFVIVVGDLLCFLGLILRGGEE